MGYCGARGRRGWKPAPAPRVERRRRPV